MTIAIAAVLGLLVAGAVVVAPTHSTSSGTSVSKIGPNDDAEFV